MEGAVESREWNLLAARQQLLEAHQGARAAVSDSARFFGGFFGNLADFEHFWVLSPSTRLSA